jgi:hypothetical protein
VHAGLTYAFIFAKADPRWGSSSPTEFLRLASPGPPEDSFVDVAGRAWNELGPEDLIELM